MKQIHAMLMLKIVNDTSNNKLSQLDGWGAYSWKRDWLFNQSQDHA